MKQLKDFRLNHGYSRKQMAELMDISLSQYDKVEFSQREPSQRFLKKFKQSFPEFDMNIFFEQSQHDLCNLTVQTERRNEAGR